MTEFEIMQNKMQTYSKQLLGEYDKDANYVLSGTIAESIVECKKKITVFKEEYLQAVAFFDGFSLEFKIDFAKDGQNKQASLLLIESVDKLEKTEFLETFVASFEDYNDELFISKLKTAFNLYTFDQSLGKDIINKNETIEKIKRTKKSSSKLIFLQLNYFSKNYVKQLLELLKQEGVAEEVLLELKEKLKKIKQDELYWINLKVELDKILIAKKDRLSKEFVAKMEELNKMATKEFEVAEKSLQQKESKPKAKAAAKKGKKAAGDDGASKKSASKAKKKVTKKESKGIDLEKLLKEIKRENVTYKSKFSSKKQVKAKPKPKINVLGRLYNKYGVLIAVDKTEEKNIVSECFSNRVKDIQQKQANEFVSETGKKKLNVFVEDKTTTKIEDEMQL